MAPELAQRIGELEAMLEGMPAEGDVLPRVRVLRELGIRLDQANQPAKALAATSRALCLLARAGLHRSRDGAVLRLDLADRWMSSSRLRQAVIAYGRSVAELEISHGPDSKVYWAARNRWGVAAATAGDFDVARRELEAAVDHQRQRAALDPAEKADLVVTLLDLIRFERNVGRLDRATVLLDESCDVAKAVGNHDLLADVMEQLGALATLQREFPHAVKFHTLALNIRGRRLGPTHPLTLHSLTALGEAYARGGRLEEARAVLEKARSHGTQAALDRTLCETILAEVLFKLGATGASHGAMEHVAEQFDSMNHRLATLAHRDAAFTAFKAGDVDKAVRHAWMAIESATRLWQTLQRYGSEADLLAWQAITDVISACAVVAGRNSGPIERALFSFKAAVAYVMTGLRHAPQSIPLWGKLEEARARLRQMEVAPGTLDTEVAAARNAVERIESQLAAQSAAVMTDDDVRSAPAGWRPAASRSLVVDFIRFQVPTPDHGISACYGALVHTADAGARWFDLGPAGTPEGIDAKLQALHELLRSPLLPQDEELCRVASALYAAVWAPIAGTFEGTFDEVVLIPDGPLNLLSFGILWDGRQFVGERVRLRYLSSIRGLLPKARELVVTGPCVVVSDPDFDRASADTGVAQMAKQVGRQVLEWLALRGTDGLPREYSRLDGSRLEGERVVAEWSGNGLVEVRHLTDRTATKGAVLACVRPRFLHLATHGQYVDGSNLPRNPMLRSWLALAGANRTLSALAEGRVPELSDDGLLRADEIRGMDLRGTELVALSACDTGIGAVRAGEGVFGLRRAFHEAGARNLLLTLWPVSDQRTADFIPGLYQRVLSGVEIAEALYRIQSEALAETRSHLGAAAAARLFGAFVLSAG
jgi:CHAT domain-containing protein/tetratricopeptide (TPR) repeat protein